MHTFLSIQAAHDCITEAYIQWYACARVHACVCVCVCVLMCKCVVCERVGECMPVCACVLVHVFVLEYV